MFINGLFNLPLDVFEHFICERVRKVFLNGQKEVKFTFFFILNANKGSLPSFSRNVKVIRELEDVPPWFILSS